MMRIRNQDTCNISDPIASIITLSYEKKNIRLASVFLFSDLTGLRYVSVNNFSQITQTFPFTPIRRIVFQFSLSRPVRQWKLACFLLHDGICFISYLISHSVCWCMTSQRASVNGRRGSIKTWASLEGVYDNDFLSPGDLQGKVKVERWMLLDYLETLTFG